MNRTMSNNNNGQSPSIRGRARRRTRSAPRNPFATFGRTMNQKFKPRGRSNDRDGRSRRTIRTRSRSGGSRRTARTRSTSGEGRSRGSRSNSRGRCTRKKGMFAELHVGKKGLFARQQQQHGESGDEERGYSSSSRHSLNKPSPTSNLIAHPWILPPHLRLAPRTDIWVLFAISSCATSASMISQGSFLNGTGVKFALITCGLSFTASVVVACGMRYAPLRTTLTRGLFDNTRGTASSGQTSFLAGLNITPELLLVSILLAFWMASMPIIINGNSSFTNSSTSLAMGDIWNANLYYSAWTSFLLLCYLWVEVTTLADRRGTMLKKDEAENTFTKRWTFLGIISIVFMATCAGVYTSASCAGELLKSTNYCFRSLLGILFGGIQLLILVAVGTLYRLSQMNNPGLSVDKRNKGNATMSLLSLGVQSVNTALLTSPIGGGPGNVSGTLYFGSWLGFLLGLELCLRYLEFYSSASLNSDSVISNGGAIVKRRSTKSLMDDVTAYDTEDAYSLLDDLYSVLDLKYGSEDGSTSARKQLRNSPGHVVMVEDDDDLSVGVENIDDVQLFVSSDSVDMDDVRSFSPPVTQQTTGQGPVQLCGITPPSAPTSNGVPSIKRSLSRNKDTSPSINASKTCPTSVIDPVGSKDVTRVTARGITPPSVPASYGVPSIKRSLSRTDTSPSINASKTCPTSVLDPVGSKDVARVTARGITPPSVPASFGVPSIKRSLSRKDTPPIINAPKTCPTSVLDPVGSKDVARVTARLPISDTRPTNSSPTSAKDPVANTRSRRSLRSQRLENSNALKSSMLMPHPTNYDALNELNDSGSAVVMGDVVSKIPKPPISRHSRNDSSPSTLQDGSGEESGPETISPNTISPNNTPSASAAAPSSQVGNNLRKIQAVQGVVHHAQHQQQNRHGRRQQQQKSIPSIPIRTKSTKKNSLKSKSSRSRSREKKNKSDAGLARLSTLNVDAGSRTAHSTSVPEHSSRASTATSRQSTMASVPCTLSRCQEDDSSMLEQGGMARMHHQQQQANPQLSGHSKKSMGSRLGSVGSGSTLSSRGLTLSADIYTVILTDDDEESGSNPPPTISDDGWSHSRGDLSGLSGLLNKLGGNNKKNEDTSGCGDRRGGPPPPPPPPLRRSSPPHEQQFQHDHDVTSRYSPAPVRSIHTNGSSGKTDTAVSGPTPTPKHRNNKNGSSSRYRNSSGSTNSYNKKYTDETEIHQTSSDENPSSHEGGGSGTKALSRAKKTRGQPHNPTLHLVRPPTQSTSFVSAGPGAAADDLVSMVLSQANKSYSMGNQRSEQSAAAVDDLVAKMLTHALGQQPQLRPQNLPVQRCSMYSDDSKFSKDDLGMGFSC